MKIEQTKPDEPYYYSLPVQVSELKDGVLLRRGVEQLKISGSDELLSLLDNILSCTTKIGGSSISDIYAECSLTDRESVDLVIEALQGKRFLLPMDGQGSSPQPDLQKLEAPQDIFFWSYNCQPQAEKIFEETQLALVGVNHINYRLASALAETGYQNIDVVDHPMLRNLNFYEDDGTLLESRWSSKVCSPISYDDWLSSGELPDCLVVSTDFGGLYNLREWNEHCIENGITFFPVALQDMVGYIGPWVYPKDSPCLECFWDRQNSHLENPELERFAERTAYYGQLVSSYLPAMASMLGDMAAIEIVKRQILGQSEVGKVLEVKLLESGMQSHSILRVPHCRVCSSATTFSPVTIDRNIFMPGNQ